MTGKIAGLAVAALLVMGLLGVLSQMTPIKSPPSEPKTAPITVPELIID